MILAQNTCKVAICTLLMCLLCTYTNSRPVLRQRDETQTHDTSALASDSDSTSHGVVTFENSCIPSVKDAFNNALMLLYAFEYSDAVNAFVDIISDDPNCCMAFFFAASSYTTPIWSFISDQNLEITNQFSNQAQKCFTANIDNVLPREVAYLDALQIYADITDMNTISATSPSQRLQNYAVALKDKVYTPYASVDENAGIIYGLSLLAVGYYSSTEASDGYKNLIEAARVEEEVLATNPVSPGALHYIIHAYDQPALAYKAKDAAYAFADIADGVPHQIHMPSHIYSDLGIWSDSVTANINSLNAAYSENEDKRTGDWWHGSYFLQYAMLQLAMDCDANAFQNTYKEFAPPNGANVDPMFSVKGEDTARIPCHFLIETRDWETAANFSLTEFYSTTGNSTEIWENQPYTLIYSNFVQTVGRSILNQSVNDIQTSVNAVLAANNSCYNDINWSRLQLPYYRNSFNLMVLASQAWLTFRSDSYEAGISAMLIVCTEQKNGWYPEVAHMWDANEQLAQMYLIRANGGTNTSDIALALEMYETSIAVYPNRYHTLAGAASCSAILGGEDNTANACKYYTQLLALTNPTDPPLPSFVVDGISPAVCSTYLPDRRPELALGIAYISNPLNNCAPQPIPVPPSLSKKNDIGLTTGAIVGISFGVILVSVIIWLVLNHIRTQRKKELASYDLLQEETEISTHRLE